MSLFQTLVPSFRRASPAEDGAVSQRSTVKPVYEIKQTTDAYAVTVYLPGVAKDAVEITNEDAQFRVFARRAWQQPANWTAVYRESTDAPYELVLNHDNTIDSDKIAAELVDGVLRVSLPKTEAVKPRKIAVA
ncbi:MAG TPA: Hsp20/alpha crystallin family protein [Opitutaceae bacterium]|nr:Hsp20/alpha crystallin family protein [Opitutaceae bacterium]